MEANTGNDMWLETRRINQSLSEERIPAKSLHYMGDMEAAWSLFPRAIDLVVPSAALTKVDSNVAVHCQNTRDFFGCVRSITT